MDKSQKKRHWTEFWRELRVIRLIFKWTQKDAGEVLGISRQMLGQYERHNTELTKSMAYGFAAIFRKESKQLSAAKAQYICEIIDEYDFEMEEKL